MPRKQTKSAKKAKKAVPAAREEKEETIVAKGKMTPRRSPRGSSSSASYVDKTSEPPSPKPNRLTRSSRSSAGKGSAPKEKVAKLEGVEFGSSEEEEEEEEEVASEEGSEYEVDDEDEDDYKPTTRKLSRAKGKRGAKGKGPKSPSPKKSTRAGRKRKASKDEDEDDDDDDDGDDKSYRGKLNIDEKSDSPSKSASGRPRRAAKRSSAQEKAEVTDEDGDEQEEGNEEEEEVEKVSSRGRPQRSRAAAATAKSAPVKSTRASKDKQDKDNAPAVKRTSRPSGVWTGEGPSCDERAPPLKSRKRCRRGVTLEVKLDVLRRLDADETLGNISRSLGLPSSTICTIRANRDAILAARNEADLPLSAVVLRYNRNDWMVKMEQSLNEWISRQTDDDGNTRLSVSAIQEKARSLYRDLSGEDGGGDKPAFSASRGWFERFKKRCNLHDLKLAASEAGNNAETVATRKYARRLKKVIDDGGYVPEQVFSVDETVLFWKGLPKEDLPQERIALLLGGNAAGDFKLRPLAVHRTENPSESKDLDPAVIWRRNGKCAMSEAMFKEWFVSLFVPAVKGYCAKRNISYKCLLVVDSAPIHPNNLNDLTDNVRVEYIPKNTTKLLHPMSQGVIANFKVRYLRWMFEKLSGTKELGILDAVDGIAKAWHQVDQTTMNGAWRNVWPKCALPHFDLATQDESLKKIESDVVTLARNLGYFDVTEDDVLAFLTDETLTEDEPESSEEEEEEEEPVQLRLTMEQMSKAFALVDESLEIFSTNDPNRERSLKVVRAIFEDLRCYREMYRDLRKRRRTANSVAVDEDEDEEEEQEVECGRS